MAFLNLTGSSPATLSILSLGADSSPKNQSSDFDVSPISKKTYKQNQESLITLFSLGVKRYKEAPETFSMAVNNEKCTCTQFYRYSESRLM